MRKDKVVSFRMNDDDKQCLDNCLKLFNGYPRHEVPDTFSKKMLFLIHNYHDDLAEKNRAIMFKDKQIQKLNDKIKELNGESKDNDKAQGPPLPVTIKEKPKLPKLKPPKVDYVDCPSLNKKVMKVQCDVCKAKDWDKWKACQEFKREQTTMEH